MTDFGAELTRLMDERGIGVRELHRMSHYEAGYISNLRNGKRRPSGECAAKLDKVLEANGRLAALAPAAAPDTPEVPARVLTQGAIDFAAWAESATAAPTPPRDAEKVRRSLEDALAGGQMSPALLAG
jgi:hypothetical protein